MSTSLGNQLPQNLVDDLNGRDLTSRWARTLPLVTIDDQGFPHFAILSYGEILSVGPRTVRLGMYPNSSTSRNMRARPRVALLLVHGDSLYYIKGTAAEQPAPDVARFEVTVEAVLVDNEPGAHITSGLTFEMAQGKQWWLDTASKTLAALRDPA